MAYWIENVSIRELMETAEMVSVRKNIYELNLLAKTTLATLPSAKGEHGDIHLHKLIARAMIVYKSAGGGGYTSKNAAFPFMELLMKYVTDLAHVHVGYDHAYGMTHKTRGDQLTELIKDARRKKWLWE
jgi:pyridoxal/pyridoxine/pyridoxamine kinase